MKRLLREDLVLRGWEKLPYAVVERPHNGVTFVDARTFEALSLRDGQLDLSLPIISDEVRAIVEKLEEQGAVRPCEPGERLTPDQEYRCHQNRFVRTAHWSITGKCNYRCRHCYMSAPDAKLGEIDHDTMMDLARQIADCGILEVSLTGGEPLVRRDFMELVDALLSYRIRIAQIYTNGKLVDEKLLDQLEERGIRPEFNMSYDGTQGWHDWMRGVPGAGDAVLAAFDLCHERGFPTGAEMCLHQGNKHLLRESVSTLAAHHCESLKVNPVADTDTWERLGEDRSLTLEETFEVYLDYIPCFYEDGAPLGLHLGGFFMGRPGSGDWTIPNIGKHPEERDPAACASQVTCGHARQTLYLSPEARMLPCMALSSMPMQERYPLATEIGLRQGLSDSEYLSLIDTRVSALWEHNPECAQCEHRGACAGGCRASALFTARSRPVPHPERRLRAPHPRGGRKSPGEDRREKGERMKQDMKEFMAKVSEDEGLRVKLEALAGLPEDEVAARMAAIACEAGFEVAVEDLDPAETELDESELAAVSGGSVIVSPLFKCNYQQDNTLCCASCAYSRFSYPNLYCFLDKNEGGPKPAEVMPLQSNGNLQ